MCKTQENRIDYYLSLTETFCECLVRYNFDISDLLSDIGHIVRAKDEAEFDVEAEKLQVAIMVDPKRIPARNITALFRLSPKRAMPVIVAIFHAKSDPSLLKPHAQSLPEDNFWTDSSNFLYLYEIIDFLQEKKYADMATSIARFYDFAKAFVDVYSEKQIIDPPVRSVLRSIADKANIDIQAIDQKALRQIFRENINFLRKIHQLVVIDRKTSREVAIELCDYSEDLYLDSYFARIINNQIKALDTTITEAGELGISLGDNELTEAKKLIDSFVEQRLFLRK